MVKPNRIDIKKMTRSKRKNSDNRKNNQSKRTLKGGDIITTSVVGLGIGMGLFIGYKLLKSMTDGDKNTYHVIHTSDGGIKSKVNRHQTAIDLNEARKNEIIKMMATQALNVQPKYR